MVEVTREKETKSDVIYWDELHEKQQAILDVFERSPEPMFWTSELLEQVDFTKPTLLNHLEKLVEVDIVGKKGNGKIIWWRETDTQILPGSRGGLSGTIRRWFPTSTGSEFVRTINELALLGAGLVLLGMFTIIVAFYIQLGASTVPVILGLSQFNWGLLIGLAGFLFMAPKFGSILGMLIASGVKAVSSSRSR